MKKNAAVVRTTVGRLRRALVEAIVTEMPLAALLKPVEEPIDPHIEDIEKAYHSSPEDYHKEKLKNKKSVERFFKNPAYLDKAVKAFKNLALPVYVVPAYARTFDEEQRVDVLEGEGAKEYLTQACKLSPEKVDELMGAMSQGAVVFVPFTDSLQKGFLPTPWMLVHALYDNSTRGENDLLPLADDTCNIVNDLFADERFQDPNGLKKIFTFASARNRQVESENDITAEILTQATLTTKGFVYNETGDEEIDERLAEIAELVKDARAGFEQAVGGKLVKVNVFQST